MAHKTITIRETTQCNVLIRLDFYISMEPTPYNRNKARQVLMSVFGKNVPYIVPDQTEPGKEICVYIEYNRDRQAFAKTPAEYKDLLLTCWQRLTNAKITGIGYIVAAQSLPILNSRAIATPFQIASSESDSEQIYRENFAPLKDQTLTIQELQSRELTPESIVTAKLAYLRKERKYEDAKRCELAWEEQVNAQALEDMKRLFIQIAKCDPSSQAGIKILHGFLEARMVDNHGSEFTSENPLAYEKLNWNQCELYYQIMRVQVLGTKLDPNSLLVKNMRSMRVPDSHKGAFDNESILYKLFLGVENPKKLRENPSFLAFLQEQPLQLAQPSLAAPLDTLRKLEKEIIGEGCNKKWKTACFGGVNIQIKNIQGIVINSIHITSTMEKILNRITQARLNTELLPDKEKEIYLSALGDIHKLLGAASQQNNQWQAKFFGRKEQTKIFYTTWNEKLNRLARLEPAGIRF